MLEERVVSAAAHPLRAGFDGPAAKVDGVHAPADAVGALQKEDVVDAERAQLLRGGQPGQTAADDDDRRVVVAHADAEEGEEHAHALAVVRRLGDELVEVLLQPVRAVAQLVRRERQVERVLNALLGHGELAARAGGLEACVQRREVGVPTARRVHGLLAAVHLAAHGLDRVRKVAPARIVRPLLDPNDARRNERRHPGSRPDSSRPLPPPIPNVVRARAARRKLDAGCAASRSRGACCSAARRSQ